MNFTSLLNSIGIYSEDTISFINIFATLFIAFFSGWIAYLITQKWVAKAIIKIVKKTSFTWDDLLLDQKLFNRLGLFIAPIVILTITSSLEWEYMGFLKKLLNSWIVISVILLISSILDGINRVYESFEMSKDKPIKVFIQVVMIFIYCIGIISIIGIFTEKSVTVLIGGLAAFAAVLMLIFQNSILGLVAGIQLSVNDMLHIGDWIVMPSSGADGDVIEINLTTVKVQNWDKTITTIPTHKLVTDSFTNWRGMVESKGRRIKRSVNIDINSIHYLSQEELTIMKQSDFLKEYIEKKEAEIAEYNSKQKNMLDERRLTNIGTFREYMEAWLASNPKINQEMTHMVRQLQPGPTGLPLEIYCFSAIQKWIDYENVQSDIFDHIFAVMELFHLKPFQYFGNVVSGEQ